MTDSNLSSVTIPLSEDSDDYGYVEYFLQVSCRTSRVKLRKVWGLSQGSDATQRFDERSQGLLVLPCFIQLAQLDQLNSVQGVCERGFRLDSNGILIQVGNFLPPGLSSNFSDAERMQEKFCYEAFLCHVCVGKSHLHTIDDSDKVCAEVSSDGMLDSIDTAKILNERPADYDSVYIHRRRENFFGARLRTLPQHTFQHEYIIPDAAQILPLYLVHYEIDFGEKDKLILPLCDSCGSKPAVIWCEADAARLCAECDHDLHSLNKIVARHVRVPVFEQPRYMGSCKEHKGEEIFRYCESCSKPLCAVCLRAGSHSAPGIIKTHAIIPLQDAYRAALRANSSTDMRLLEKQSTIKQTLMAIEDFVSQVSENLADIELIINLIFV